jgi:NADPH-dependent F420 reductase
MGQGVVAARCWKDADMTQTPKLALSPPPNVAGLTVGVLGGTGDQGRGLAYRLAVQGQRVIIGSRVAARAMAAATEIGFGVQGAVNAECAGQSDIVIVAVPWDGHADLLRALAPELNGKTVIDCVNPLGFDKEGAFALAVPEGSATQQAAALLPDSNVAGAFHHVSAVTLLDADVVEMDLDVLVLGDDRTTTDLTIALVNRIPGMRGVYAGRLRNAHQIESLTANLISVNRRYKAHAGIRLTGV